MTEERKKRAVAVEKQISELLPEDVRVKVVGTVIEKDPSNNSVLIDDGKSKLRILLSAEPFKQLDVGKTIRCIGVVSPSLIQGVQEVELRGELVQDFSKLDKNLYNKYLNFKSSKQ